MNREDNSSQGIGDVNSSSPAAPTREPIRLRLADVIAAGRAAYEEGRLSAQGPSPACMYRDFTGRPCVIGAAVTEDQARAMAGTVSYLAMYGLVSVPPRELSALVALQRAHDRWVGGEWQAEAELRSLLGLANGSEATKTGNSGMPK